MAAIVTFVLAVASLVGGSFLVRIGLSERAEGKRLAAAPRLGFAELRAGPPGTLGVLEGRLAESNPELAHGLVLFTRSTLYGHRKDDDGRERPIWKTEERSWPALRLEIDGGEVLLESGYALTLLGSDPSIVAPEASASGETERFEGLKRGQPVAVLGTIARAGVEPVFAAERLFSGTLEDARSGAASGALFGLIGGAVLLVAGAVLAIVGAAML